MRFPGFKTSNQFANETITLQALYCTHQHETVTMLLLFSVFTIQHKQCKLSSWNKLTKTTGQVKCHLQQASHYWMSSFSCFHAGRSILYRLGTPGPWVDSRGTASFWNRLGCCPVSGRCTQPPPGVDSEPGFPFPIQGS